MKSKIRGMFLGAAIGDALGMPVETFTPEQIVEKYPQCAGRVTEYMVPTGHKWFDGREAGTWTDDTQLTLAVANAICGSNLNMDGQIEAHVTAFKESTAGWGGSTKESVRQLVNGVSWTKSGASGEWRGKGNGVCMKISPLAAYMSIQIAQNKFSEPRHVEFTKQIYKFASELTIMTHRTTMAIQATIAQLVALTYCLSPYCDFEAGDQFDDQQFVTLITDASHYAKRIATNFGLEEDKEDITAQFQKLHDHTEYNTDRTRAEFGNGSCYLLHSIPFSLMFFVKNPHSMDAMYDVISAGGDADTNGSMVGSLLGALHGEGFFPVDLVAELDRKEEVLEVADKFCDTFIRAS